MPHQNSSSLTMNDSQHKIFTAELNECQQIATEKKEEWQIKLLQFDSLAGSLGRDAFTVIIQSTLIWKFVVLSVPINAHSNVNEPKGSA